MEPKEQVVNDIRKKVEELNVLCKLAAEMGLSVHESVVPKSIQIIGRKEVFQLDLDVFEIIKY